MTTLSVRKCLHLPPRIKVSVVIPTYNSLEGLRITLQSLTPFREIGVEVIIADGLSTDGTIDFLRTSDLLDIWFSEKDSGIYDAINKGVAIANGDWIYVVGSGDTVLPGFGEMVSLLRDPHKLYYGNVRLMDSGKSYSGPFHKWKLFYKNICHQAIFTPKAWLIENPYCARFRVFADYAFNLQAYGNHPSNFEYRRIDICNYDNITGLSNQIKDDGFYSEKHTIIKGAFGCFDAFAFQIFSMIGKRLMVYDAIIALRHLIYRRHRRAHQ